ncbi:tyrosine-type recombinase/integrase [Subtercola sp. YIM 133946]|uniref:tyrosine-type recombinase/integrase n=1 Tax=Subtercola sp. YIM 133946 TaxID=3118909 RepID=UPI002F95CE46
MGTIESYESASGKKYRVRFRKPDHTQTRKNGFITKREAERFLREVETAKDTGTYIDAGEARASIGELGATWMTHQTHLKPSSFRAVEVAWRLHVEPSWGPISVGDIRHSEVQAWVSKLSGDRSATTVLRAYGILAAILDVAVKDRRVMSNPARGVNLPRKTPKPRVYLSHGQVQLVADQAGDQGDLVLFLAYTGLRWGEATALRVRSLDALRRRVSVTENAVQVGGPIVIGTPKNHSSRSVPYPPFLSEALAARCVGKSKDELLFSGPSGHIRLPDSRRGWFASAVRAAQKVDPDLQRVTVHDLRHTAASLAISSGANVKAVQRMLGHASAAMTLDTYADLFDDDLDAVALALGEAKAKSSVSKMCPNEVQSIRKTP